MPRPIWSGTISFGLVNVPVTLHSAERPAKVKFHLLDARDKQPIRYERVNAHSGKPVPWKEVIKAYEYRKGDYVVIDEDELRAAAPEATQTVALEAFVDADQIDPMYTQKPYYLVPGKRAEKGYVLLRELLAKSGKVGIARVVIRTRQYLAMLFPKDHALVLDLLRFPQEIVAPDAFALPAGGSAKYKVSARELQMAQTLLDSMTVKWNPADYKDEFHDKLRELLENRVARHKGTVHRAEQTPAPTTNVVDFMALLKQSLQTRRAPPKRAAKPRRAVKRRVRRA